MAPVAVEGSSVPAVYLRDQLRRGPVLFVACIWGVNQLMEELPVSRSCFASQMNKSI